MKERKGVVRSEKKKTKIFLFLTMSFFCCCQLLAVLFPSCLSLFSTMGGGIAGLEDDDDEYPFLFIYFNFKYDNKIAFNFLSYISI
jgi:hypothetical protein